MGIFTRQVSKQFSKRQTEDRSFSFAPIEAPAFLTFGERTMLSMVPVLERMSPFKEQTNVNTDQSSQTTIEDAVNSEASILRLEGGWDRRCRLELGCVTSSGTFVSDWTVNLDAPNDQQLDATVPHYRMFDGTLRNKKAFKTLMDTVEQQAVTRGAVQVERGLPNVASLVQTGVMENPSAFAGDYVLPPPAALQPGVWVQFPADATEALRARVAEKRQLISALAVVRPDPTAELSFAADIGVAGADARVDLELTTGAQLVFRCPAWSQLSVFDQCRVTRRGLAATSLLSKVLGDDHPGRAACESFLGGVREMYKDRSLTESWHPEWSTSVPHSVVGIAPEQSLPVGVLVQTNRSPNDLLWAAETSLLMRSRTRATGFRKKQQEKTRTLHSRRGALVRQAAEPHDQVPRLRYTASELMTPDGPVSAYADGEEWFWEVTARGVDLDGEPMMLVMASGLSTAGGYLSYGTELLTLFQAVADIARSSNPDAVVDHLALTRRA